MSDRYVVQRRAGLFARWETLWTSDADEPVYLGRGDGKVTNAGRAADLVGRRLRDRQTGSGRRRRVRVIAV
mgnify:CR=1 FL=1